MEDYRRTLERIAEHYEGADLTGDESAKWVVNTAARILGWTVTTDIFGQVKLDKAYYGTDK